MDRGCHNCEAAVHEAVVNYREWAAMMQLWQDRFARRGKDSDNKIERVLKYKFVRSFYE